MQQLKDNYTKDLQATGNSTRARSSEAEVEEENKKEEGASPSPAVEIGGDGTPVEFKMLLADKTTANITAQILDQWEEAFRFLSVRGEVATLVERLSQRQHVSGRWKREEWRNACSGWLAKRDSAAKTNMAQHDPTFDPNDPDGSKAAIARRDETKALIAKLSQGTAFAGEA